MEEKMKKQLTVISILAFGLLMTFLIMSCGSGPQNANKDLNAANENANKAIALKDSDNPCKETNSNEKVKKLKKALETKIAGDEDDTNPKDPLSYQYNKSFFIDFAEGTGDDAGYAVATVTGAVQGKYKFKKLVDFTEDFVDKNCKVKVVFQVSTREKFLKYPPTGFEWCEYPLMACPGGYCAASCDRLENSNSNSNTHANMNSNVNRPPGNN
jgi:hypothetical protein